MNPPPPSSYNIQPHVSWDRSRLELDRYISRLRCVMRHERGERLWNVDLTRLVNDCFSLRGSLRAGSHVEIGTEYDLFDSELHGGTLLRDVPMQKAVVDIVQRRKYGDEGTQKPRGQIGTHIPDMVSLHTVSLPNEDLTLRHLAVISLVGEIKITKLERRNGKLVVAVHPQDDPELEEEFSVSHFSISSNAETGDIAVDGGKKWMAGLLKAVIYVQTCFEYCGTVLGHFILGARFTRIVMCDSGHLLLECCGSFLAERSDRTLRMAEFLCQPTNVKHMPWNLASGDIDSLAFDEPAVDRLLGIHELAMNILSSHAATYPEQPFRQLDRLWETQGVRTILAEISGLSTDSTLDVVDKTALIETSRPLRSKKLGGGKNTSSTNPRNDDDEPQQEDATNPSGTPSPLTRLMTRGAKEDTQVLRAPIDGPSMRDSHEGADDDKDEAEERKSGRAEGIEIWRSDIAPDLSFPHDSSADPSFGAAVVTPPEALEPNKRGDIVSDMGSDDGAVVLEAADMLPDSWVQTNCFAPDSDFEDDDEEPVDRPSLTDLMAAIDKLNIKVTLIEPTAMDRVIDAMSAAVLARMNVRTV